MLRWACFLLAVFLLNFSAPTFAADNDSFDKAVKLRVEQYEDELKTNGFLRGFEGAAFVISNMRYEGRGNAEYWCRDATMKKDGLDALSKWIASHLQQLSDPTLKTALRTIVSSIGALPESPGDSNVWCARAEQYVEAAKGYYQTLNDLRMISDQRLDKINLTTQARAIAESDPEAFARIMTEGLKSTLAQLDSDIASKTDRSKEAEATSTKVSQKLADLTGKVDAMTSRLVRAERQSASLNTTLQSVQAQVQALVATGTRGQDRVQVNGLEKVSGPESVELKDQLVALADHVISVLREKLSDRAKPKFQFNPNLTLTYTIKKSLNKNYGVFRFRRGVRKVLAQVTVDLEISDGIHTTKLTKDLQLSFFPQNKNELRLDLRRFVEKDAMAELKIMQKLSAGTAKYDDVLNAIETKLRGQCDAILGELAAPLPNTNGSDIVFMR